MNSDREFERIATEWIHDGSDWTPPEVIDAVLLAVRTTPQERDLRVPWRTQSMRHLLYAAAVVAVLAVAGVAAIFAFGPGLNVGTGPTPSSTTEQTTPPSPTPNASPIDTTGPIDTTSWTTYTSSQHGFTIGHPADWTVRPAERAWDLETDAPNWLSPAMDDFIAPTGDVRVSAWSVPADLGPDFAGAAEVELWVEEYCQKTSSVPCAEIHDRAVPLCLERRDCHPGLLVPFDEDTQAFFTNGAPGEDMFVVVIWRPESDPSVTGYGGARRLLEGFLATMCVWPEDARPPFEEQIHGC